MNTYNNILFIVICIIFIIFIIIISIKQEAFQQQESQNINNDMLTLLYNNIKTRQYLNDLIKADYIQSYPWFANNPNGATSYNMSLFKQSNNTEEIETQTQNYYDFGEITYIGNPV